MKYFLHVFQMQDIKKYHYFMKNNMKKCSYYFHVCMNNMKKCVYICYFRSSIFIVRQDRLCRDAQCTPLWCKRINVCLLLLWARVRIPGMLSSPFTYFFRIFPDL